jgi:hypothetical protein
MRRTLLIPVILLGCVFAGRAQQTAGDFNPPIGKPAYEADRGPRVAIDSAHGNFHTVDGGYQGYATLLRRDGYRVSGSAVALTDEALGQIDLFVTANATGPRTAEGGAPSSLSAFNGAEVAAVERWVRGGGALLIVADHEPWPAAVATLAAPYGVEFKNAYAYDGSAGSLTYRKSDGSLADHAVTNGVGSVATFLGSAFRVTGAHVPLMRLGPAAVARPALGGAPHPQEVPIGGWLQGAILEHGRGRVAVFSEAAMLTTQVRGGRAMGMNAPGAEDNARFVLNVMRWLTRG